MRQQLTIYRRIQKQPPLRTGDRVFRVVLLRLWSAWDRSRIIVQPETVIAWHRQGFNFLSVDHLRRVVIEYRCTTTEPGLRRRSTGFQIRTRSRSNPHHREAGSWPCPCSVAFTMTTASRPRIPIGNTAQAILNQHNCALLVPRHRATPRTESDLRNHATEPAHRADRGCRACRPYGIGSAVRRPMDRRPTGGRGGTPPCGRPRRRGRGSWCGEASGSPIRSSAPAPPRPNGPPETR